MQGAMEQRLFTSLEADQEDYPSVIVPSIAQ